MARGCDISEWQGVLPPEWFDQWDFVIIRAHTGYRYDRVFGQNWNNSAGRTKRGVYVFQVGDTDPTWQAQQAIDIVGFLNNGEPEIGYWSDAERNPDGVTVSPDQVQSFIDHVAGAGKKVGGYYSSLSTGWATATVLQDDSWWMAAYGNNDGNYHEQSPPREWVIHQYTSNPLDTNVADDEWWRAQNGDPVLYQGSPNWLAICSWQQFLKIPVNGIWDEFMTQKVGEWQKFIGFIEEYPAGNPIIAQKSWDTRRFLESIPKEPETANGDPIIYKGSPNWMAICDWQTFLKIPVTGIFDDVMAQSLLSWQNFFGFTEEFPQGNVLTGEKSWATRKFIESQPTDPPVDPGDPPVDPGDPGDPPPPPVRKFTDEEIALIVEALREVSRPRKSTVKAFKTALRALTE